VNPVVKVGGAVAEIVGVLPVPDHAGVWKVQVRVPAGIETNDAVGLIMQLRRLDNTTIESNEVTFALEN
jgi:uncharacterized protein (TIGR03437 family)